MPSRHSVTGVALLLCCASALATVSAAPGPIVQTQYGPVQGFKEAKYKGWLGIPYAASTGGSNRFMPPQPRAPWTSPRNSTWWGPGCYQTHHNADVPKVLSEDCLNLNVFTPVWANETSSLPVMIFWHGGAFDEGSNQGPFYMYDGKAIAGTKSVVVVTANYRLGGLGWAVTDEIKGNMGFKDQVFALQWLQKNIGNFGGDPKQVTIWGESAGAMSVGLHLVSSKSNGLYTKAIMESNPSGMRYRNLADASMYGNDMCTILGCMKSTCNTTCMQQVSVDQIGHAWSKAGNDWLAIVFANWDHWLDAFLDTTPVIDGDWIPENPMLALPAGNFNKDIPILFGTNNNEGSTFIYAAFHDPMPSALFQFLTWGIFFDEADSILQEYKNITSIGEWDDGRTWFSRILTDYWFRCASEQFGTAVSKAGSKAFVYRYNHLFSDSTLFPKFGLPAICENRTCHASELPFVFGDTHIVNADPPLNVTMTPVEKRLAASFIDYWTSFAIHGDPNIGNTQPEWPAFDPATGGMNIVLQDNIATESAQTLCDFWDGIGYMH